ncbi:MAG TPA: thiamine-phosphate kinase [Candidatus Bathyarchaeia archaeon]|nr:thiamine-phosphate kinase [Candidatus Bathyarchaeia archaeon]
MKTLRTLGERKIIEIIQNHLSIMPKMPIPFGDDVAAYDVGRGKLAILKTDMLVDKTDVPKGMSRWQAARKAVVMNISDFAAKGVNPLAMLVSLGLPRNLSQKDVGEIGDGLNAGAREYGTYVIGGDTGESSDLIISLSVFGVAEEGKLMLRSGAKVGDFVVVTGFFGKTSAGLKILVDKLKAQPALRKALVDSVLMPHARLEEGLVLSQTGAVSAAIDSSDGLAWSLHEISKASNVGFSIDKLPIASEAEKFAEANKLDPLELTLYGGEEYELVLTIKPELWKRAKRAVEKVGGQLLRIGKVTTEKRVILDTDETKRAIEPHGYEHFK